MYRRILPIHNKRYKPNKRIPNTNHIHHMLRNNTNLNPFKIQIPTQEKMTQTQCLKALNKKKWQTAKDIHKKLRKKIGIGSITSNLKQIRKYKLAKYKKIKRNKLPVYAYQKK